MSQESTPPSEFSLDPTDEVKDQAHTELSDNEASTDSPGGADVQSDSVDADVHAWRAEADSLKQQLLRNQADFENFRKRTRQEKEELQLFATRKLLADLLPVVDNFERALSSIGDDANVGDVRTGLEMVHRQLSALLEQQGVTAMDVVGQPFDPNLHNAVMQAPSDNEPPNTVIQELQKGYLLHGKVLRPAMVQVSV